MVYRLIIFIGLILFGGAEINAQLNKSILQKVYKQQKNNNNVFSGPNRFNFTRQKLNEIDSLSFINQKIDTVYLLEMYDRETGISYGSIWNKSKILNYTYYYGGTLESKPDSFFSKYMRKLVSVWDINGIRKEEDKKSSKPVSPNSIYATRIIIGKKTKIDVFSFDEFFDFNRDSPILSVSQSEGL